MSTHAISKQHRPVSASTPPTPPLTAARQALLRRLGPNLPLARLEAAARPFSNARLAQLARANVRLELAPNDAMHGARARYDRHTRLIQAGPRATLDDLRHELAHAWDDVRNDRGSFGRSPTDAFQSQVDRRYTDAFEHYQRGPTHGRGLATPGQSSSEAASSPWEFYATGFAMFHSDDPTLRANLRATSPGLYALILAEQ